MSFTRAVYLSGNSPRANSVEGAPLDPLQSTPSSL